MPRRKGDLVLSQTIHARKNSLICLDILEVTRPIQRILKFLTETVIEDISLTNENKKQNILVVSHWGLITQMARYLIQDCKCDVPDLDEDDKENILKGKCRLSNAAISKFELLVDINSGDIVSGQCLQYGCTQHLHAEI